MNCTNRWDSSGRRSIPSTGMAELAGVDRDTITAWSRRSTQLREWAAHNLTVVEGAVVGGAAGGRAEGHPPGQTRRARLGTAVGAVARRCARPAPGPRSLRCSARGAARSGAHRRSTGARLADAAEKIEKAAFTRADLVEIVGAQLPVDTERTPRELVEAAVDEVSIRLTAPRAAHQREGHERFTLDRILAEEAAVLDLVDARDDRALLWVKDEDTADLSADQKRAVDNIAPLTLARPTPVRAGGCGQDHLDARPAHRRAPPPPRHGAGAGAHRQGRRRRRARRRRRRGLTPSPKPCNCCATSKLALSPAHAGRSSMKPPWSAPTTCANSSTATTAAGAKTVLVGDAHQLAPVKARGGMFAQLCTDLPWTQHLSEVWRMADPAERTASLALRNGERRGKRHLTGEAV